MSIQKQITELHDMMLEHHEKTSSELTDIKVTVGRMDERMKNFDIKIAEHDREIKSLNKWKWGIKGIGLASLSALIKSFFNTH